MKISKLRVIGLCEGNQAVTGGFPHNGANNAENVSFDDVIMGCLCESKQMRENVTCNVFSWDKTLLNYKYIYGARKYSMLQGTAKSGCIQYSNTK